MIKVKICGITNLEDALASFFSGANAIGFVFYGKSPRFIEPLKARNISRILPRKILRVGVFVDEREETVKKIARLCNLDMLQFHGNEPAGYCKKFKGYKVIKAFRIGKGINLPEISEYKVFGRLFDAFSKSGAGGTGRKFNWNLLKNADKISGKVFLSGGLTSANVLSAIRKVRPDWVDVSSSLEYLPGKKDHKKIQRFMKAAKA
ncbi:MAG: phosphoribosylanthranilate isomerase [Candidatus Omnitrophota bacterium]